jgi:hypothetical protein
MLFGDDRMMRASAAVREANQNREVSAWKTLHRV